MKIVQDDLDLSPKNRIYTRAINILRIPMMKNDANSNPARSIRNAIFPCIYEP
jgi:hypothetical protein